MFLKGWKCHSQTLLLQTDLHSPMVLQTLSAVSELTDELQIIAQRSLICESRLVESTPWLSMLMVYAAQSGAALIQILSITALRHTPSLSNLQSLNTLSKGWKQMWWILVRRWWWLPKNPASSRGPQAWICAHQSSAKTLIIRMAA